MAMFAEALLFNQSLNAWADKVGKVQDMGGMFLNAASFNQDIEDWDVSNVFAMNQMFWGAYSFNRPLNKWGGKVGNVVFTVSFVFPASIKRPEVSHHWCSFFPCFQHGMFLNATSFNQPLDEWKLSSLQMMILMFHGASSFDQNLCSWTDYLPRNFSCEIGPDSGAFAGTSCPVPSKCSFDDLCHHCETTIVE
mmetsp:Transcript_4270/g.9600  ORF Transcript_4270/g.9600 Transcript_4270/m.9600 type:complete len:193 (+) Transcript_4270:814-1392(+)